MKKVLIITLIILNLKAYYIEDLPYYKVKEIAQCALSNQQDYPEINTQFNRGIQFLYDKKKIMKYPELIKKFNQIKIAKKRNFKSYIKGYKKIKEYFYKQKIAKKYNIPKNYAEAMFDESLFETKSLKDFNRQLKKIELLKIVIQPLLEKNNTIMINCMPKEI